jgi:hypothetical protein
MKDPKMKVISFYILRPTDSMCDLAAGGDGKAIIFNLTDNTAIQGAATNTTPSKVTAKPRKAGRTLWRPLTTHNNTKPMHMLKPSGNATALAK